ncbi:hypothetical protein AZE42_08561 [Rhizopogon vesiculosus]|uniref:Major facilitator superfamily (MFS) profile domain-containing protein n=1 Tax=Rhizopogon vesiculosus TaxID=180088 RepID=A0A1J8R222_9AGAM|nr:hypothetical protein AZE42_08561 [Rhizopogon vesiculosus]
MSLESSITELKDEKHAGHALLTREVDTGAQLVAGLISTLDPDDALRVRRKIDRHIMPLMCALYCIQFMDKTTLGSAAILGIQEATHLTTNHRWILAQIISGFISFGVLHIETGGFKPWQWLMIITGLLTLILAVSFW